MKLRSMMVVTCLLGGLGCDELANDETQGAALAVMRGTLNLADGMDPPEGELRLSIVWKGEQNLDQSDAGAACAPGDLTSYRDETPVLAQELELDTDFPAAFSAKISEPPPPGALMSLDPPFSDVKIAVGDLVAYRDVDGNGRLDQRGFDQTTSPDQVLGSGFGTKPRDFAQRTWYRIAYLTGDLHSTHTHQISGPTHAGYSLTSVEVNEKTHDAGEEETRQLDAKVEIELTLDATKYVQRWTCRDTCQVESECPADPAELPNVLALGERSPSFAEWFWDHSDGDRTIYARAECLRGTAGESTGPAREIYSVETITEENCTTTHSKCTYERGKLPEGVDIPCSEFEDNVVFPNGT